MFVLLFVQHGCTGSERFVAASTSKEELKEIALNDWANLCDAKSEETAKKYYKRDVDCCYYLMPATEPFYITDLPCSSKINFE